ncbi:MAG: metal-sensing transcriptional repressor [Lachnospiraceae bacterium]
MEEDKKCECCKCSDKTTERSEEERKKLINRLNRIEGQIRGIRKMVERDAYCTDILTQAAAVNAAIHSFNKDLIAKHIRGCVVRDIKNGDEEVIDELVDTLQKLMK